MITQTDKDRLNNVIKDWRGNIVAFSIDMLKSSALDDDEEVTKFSIQLSDRDYTCISTLKMEELLYIFNKLLEVSEFITLDVLSETIDDEVEVVQTSYIKKSAIQSIDMIELYREQEVNHESNT